MVSETVDAEGHLIDSGDLQAILTTIVEQGASYEILRFDMGRTNASPSRLSLRLSTETREGLDHLLATLSHLRLLRAGRARRDRCASTTSTAPRRRTSTPPPTTAPRCWSAASGRPWTASAWTRPSSSTAGGSNAASCAA